MDGYTGLVLEGGGMRCTFTAGVLDYFMDKGIYFPYTIGVSAGATTGISYAARQRGRARYSNIDLMKQYDYVGLKTFIKQRNIMDFNLLFNVFPKKIYPFDYQTYFNSPERFIMVTSNCLTGEAVYLEEKQDEKRVLDICVATCSLPILCPIAYVDGIPMVDGGVCDALPIRKSEADGNSRNVIVLTRNKGYRKPVKQQKLPGFVFRKYPELRRELMLRYQRYNETIEYIEQLEADGKALVIRPIRDVVVDRIERDVDKLTSFYEEGYACAKAAFEKK